LYGGTFDPPHNGHLAIARAVTGILELDRFIFVPAFHAPHKKDKNPTSPFHRFATFQTLVKAREVFGDARLFFIMGGDSWNEINTWREWEQVLTAVNIIVVTRLGHDLALDHVSDIVRDRIVDVRGISPQSIGRAVDEHGEDSIFFTDAVQLDIAATDLRALIASGDSAWKDSVPDEVAKYIEKYQIYT